MTSEEILSSVETIQARVYRALECKTIFHSVSHHSNDTSLDSNDTLKCDAILSTEFNNLTLTPSNESDNLSTFKSNLKNEESKTTYKPESLFAEALGLINFLNLYKISSNYFYIHKACSLITNVHEALGHNVRVEVNTDNRTDSDGFSKTSAARNKEPVSNGLHLTQSKNITSDYSAEEVFDSDIIDSSTTCSDTEDTNEEGSCTDTSSIYSSQSETTEEQHSEDALSNGLRSTCVCQLDCLSSGGRYHNNSKSGQHIHQLCKWMFALLQMSKVTDQDSFGKQACRLGKHVYNKFRHNKITGENKEGRRLLALYWKMDDKLKTPLVQCEGLLDTFTCLVVFAHLQEWNEEQCQAIKVDPSEDLSVEIEELNEMIQKRMPHIRALSCGMDMGEALWICSHAESSSILQKYNTEWQSKLKVLSLCNIGSYIDTALCRPRILRSGYKELSIALGLRTIQNTSKNPNKSSSEVLNVLSDLISKILNSWNRYTFIHDASITPLLYTLAVYPGIYFPM